MSQWDEEQRRRDEEQRRQDKIVLGQHAPVRPNQEGQIWLHIHHYPDLAQDNVARAQAEEQLRLFEETHERQVRELQQEQARQREQMQQEHRHQQQQMQEQEQTRQREQMQQELRLLQEQQERDLRCLRDQQQEGLRLLQEQQERDLRCLWDQHLKMLHQLQQQQQAGTPGNPLEAIGNGLQAIGNGLRAIWGFFGAGTAHAHTGGFNWPKKTVDKSLENLEGALYFLHLDEVYEYGFKFTERVKEINEKLGNYGEKQGKPGGANWYRSASFKELAEVLRNLDVSRPGEKRGINVEESLSATKATLSLFKNMTRVLEKEGRILLNSLPYVDTSKLLSAAEEGEAGDALAIGELYGFIALSFRGFAARSWGGSPSDAAAIFINKKHEPLARLFLASQTLETRQKRLDPKRFFYGKDVVHIVRMIDSLPNLLLRK